jgi:hypothetical protein
MPPFRVAVSHSDPDHPNNAASFYGPALDDAYAGLLSQSFGVDDVDLLEEAGKVAKRAKADHSGKGFDVKIVELVDNGDGTSRWEEVS